MISMPQISIGDGLWHWVYHIAANVIRKYMAQHESL
jgi:hypothetical protein